MEPIRSFCSDRSRTIMLRWCEATRRNLTRLVLPSLVCALGIVSATHAHPVSYKGSFGVMPNVSEERQDIELNYSYTPTTALGLSAIRIDDDNRRVTLVVPHLNYRIFRRNEPESQTNFYLLSGIGGKREDNSTDGTALIATQFDWETRRLYTLLGTEQLIGFDGNNLLRVRGRLGVAPYLGGFDDLHTWLIAQAEYTQELESEWMVTPIVRLFYQNYLLEIGVSTSGKFSIAGISHF